MKASYPNKFFDFIVRKLVNWTIFCNF